MRLALVALLATLSGCALIPQPAQHWPDLQIDIVRVPDGEVYANCAAAIPLWQRLLGALPLACARWDLAQRSCVVIVGSTSSEAVVAHEVAHCRGERHL